MRLRELLACFLLVLLVSAGVVVLANRLAFSLIG